MATEFDLGLERMAGLPVARKLVLQVALPAQPEQYLAAFAGAVEAVPSLVLCNFPWIR